MVIYTVQAKKIEKKIEKRNNAITLYLYLNYKLRI